MILNERRQKVDQIINIMSRYVNIINKSMMYKYIISIFQLKMSNEFCGNLYNMV